MCAHWQKTPPGRSRARAASNISRVKSGATPAIHGFDGSEMIDVVGAAAETQMGAAVADDEARAWVGERAVAVRVEEARGTDDLGRKLDGVDRRDADG